KLKPAEVKGKAFEAYLRSRQLGGENARAIVVSDLAEEKASEINSTLLSSLLPEPPKGEKSFADLPVRIWGQRECRDLPADFASYFRNLGWNRSHQNDEE